MLTHTTSTVALFVIAAGILFQLVTSARVGARLALNRLRVHQRPTARARTTGARPKSAIAPNRGRHPYRDYRAALRSAGHGTSKG
jgi:hypothetical protein